MKKLTSLLFTLSLSGCTAFVRTEAVSHESALTAPLERVFSYQQEKEGDVPIIVTRDAGFMGGGCFIGVVIEGKLAARLDPGESAKFYLPIGEVNMAAVPDPQGQGLCGVGGWDPVLEHYTLKKSAPNLFRLSLGAYRRPRITPAVY